MRVLIGCEKSGTVRRAFAARGHQVVSVDTEAAEDGATFEGYSDIGFHWRGDIIDFIYNNSTQLKDTHFDLFIAHPECRYMSVSGMHWTHRGLRDPQLTEDAVAFARLLFDAPYPRICIENPVSILSTRIRRPDQIVQPYEFGSDASKKTCLWLKNLPVLTPGKFVAPRMVCPTCRKVTGLVPASSEGCPYCGCEPGLLRPRWANQTDSGQNRLGPSDKRSAMRAETYPGIANAFADQWGKLSTEGA